MEPDALFFDFDGVLVDSEPVHYQCWREIVRPLSIDLTWDYYRRACIGVTDRAMLEALVRAAQAPVTLDQLWPHYPRKKALFRERMLRRVPIPDDVKALLAELYRHYRLALVTSSGRAEVEPLLEAAGVRGFFHTLVFGEDVARHKPAPDPYLLAARRLSVQRPLVFEDSAAGLESARAAGFQVIQVSKPGELASLVRRQLGCATRPSESSQPE